MGKKIILWIFLFILTNQLLSQRNWHLMDLKDDGYLGISLNKAYKMLEGRKSQTVIVAVIDGGVDTSHIDLKPFMWRNPKETYNGKDDDGNGYVDDIFGWNFIGNSKGENIDAEQLEVTRLYAKLRNKYENVDETKLTVEEKNDLALYKEVKEMYLTKFTEKNSYYLMALSFWNKMCAAERYIKIFLNKDTLTEDVLKPLLRSETDSVRIYASVMLKSLKNGYRIKDVENEINNIRKELLTELNPDTNMRFLVGDNPYDISDSIYGNSDVKGPGSSHGTFVAGIIAADRKNGNDALGIADNVRIMALRVVPGGDERDKDVALAIRYAVNHGAKIINMSFGKPFSPEKEFVDNAIRYATKHGVLLIHAAGNEGENNDSFTSYPSNFDEKGNKISDLLLNVGASDKYPHTNLAAFFSNYGQQTVDLFAPGVDIFSISPENRFSSSDGTSAAAPVVSGVAALLMSYFPELSPYEIKDILLRSVTDLRKVEVELPTKKGYKGYTRFKKLCVSGGVVNAEKAVKMALKMSKKKK